MRIENKYKFCYFFFLILGISVFIIAGFSPCFSAKTSPVINEQVTTDCFDNQENLSVLTTKNTNNENVKKDIVSADDSLYDFFKTFLSFIGVGNVIIGSLIVSNEKYKYGYVFQSVISDVFGFHYSHIFIYVGFWVIAMFFVCMKNKTLSIMLTLGEVFIFIAFIIVYYYISLDKNRTDELILFSIKKRIEEVKNSNPEKYHTIILDSGIRIMRYVAEKTKSGQLDSKKMIFKYVELLKTWASEKECQVFIELTRNNITEITKTDFSFMLQEILTIYLKDVVSSQKKDSKHLILNSIFEILSENKFDDLCMAIAFWLYFNTDLVTAFSMINNFLANDLSNDDDIVLYYLYAHVIANQTVSELYTEDDFIYLKKWVKNNKMRLKRLFDLIESGNSNFDEEDINNKLYLFKMRMIHRLAANRSKVYSSSLMFLNKKIIAKKYLKQKNYREYSLSPIEEIQISIFTK